MQGAPVHLDEPPLLEEPGNQGQRVDLRNAEIPGTFDARVNERAADPSGGDIRMDCKATDFGQSKTDWVQPADTE